MLLGFTNRKALAAAFQCDRRTVSKILKQIGIDHSKQLLPLEVEMFKQKVGDLVKIKD